MSNIFEDRENALLRIQNTAMSQSLEQATAMAKTQLADLIIDSWGHLNVDGMSRSQMATAIHLIRFCMISKP